jgi:hypothetical protein
MSDNHHEDARNDGERPGSDVSHEISSSDRKERYELE